MSTSSTSTWRMTRLSEVCELISSGGTPSRKHPEYYSGGQHLWVKSQELRDGRIFDTEEKITDLGLKNSSAKAYPPDTVLMAMYGATVGKLAILRHVATVNQAICAMIVDPELADHQFLFYSLLHWRDELTAKAHGAAQQNLNQGLIRDFALPMPPLHVQIRIAEMLSAYDDLIEINTRRIAILEEMAQSIYREWFVNFRFPGHEHIAMVESELGPMPEGWSLNALRDLAQVNHHSIRKDNTPDEIHYIDISSVSTGSIDSIETLPFVSAPSRARRVVTHGDVIWSTVRPNRRSYSLVLRPAADTVVSTGFAVLTATHVPYSYLYCVTTTDYFVAYLTNRARGAAYPAVTGTDFEEAPLLSPPKDLLNRFHDVVSGMYGETEHLRRRNRTLRQTRDLLLPKLISGEIDIDTLDREPVEAIA